MKLQAGKTLLNHKGEPFTAPVSLEEERLAAKENRLPVTKPIRAGTFIANHILTSQHAPKDKVARVSLLAMRMEGGDEVELTDEDSILLKEMLLQEERMTVWMRSYTAWLVAPDGFKTDEREAFSALMERAEPSLAS